MDTAELGLKKDVMFGSVWVGLKEHGSAQNSGLGVLSG